MRILLTNDDGIRAPGIVALHESLRSLGEIFTVAPLTVQSATSHGITFHEPLMTRDITVSESMQGVAVDGRPADCVKLAIECLWPQRMGGKPDLVISGMNIGCNVGIHICYSGTIGAAIEGAFLGIPAIAVSVHYEREWEHTRWDVAARHARAAIDRYLSHGPLEPHSVLNINIPHTVEDGPTPLMHVAPMNLAAMQDHYDRRQAPSGEHYYWAVGDGMDFHHMADDSDVASLLEGHIVITPLQYDLTDHARLRTWKERLEG